MFPILSTRLKCFATIVIILFSAYYGTAQMAQSQALQSLTGFFQALVQRYDAKTLPSHDEAMEVIEQVDGMRAEDIAKALPAILAAWGHSDDNVKDYAGTTIFAIGERPDGAELLRPY